MRAGELHVSRWLAPATQKLGQILNVSVKILLGRSKLQVNGRDNVDGQP